MMGDSRHFRVEAEFEDVMAELRRESEAYGALVLCPKQWLRDIDGLVAKQ